MVQFNTRANEILLKLVYYSPGLSGKTTNLQALHAMCTDANRGELFSVNTQEDRTLFFDLLPINLGYIYGNAIHLQIYTVPGQVQYDASRRVVLGGADGVVFVADSSETKMQDNVDSLSNLYHNLNANRLNIKQIPFVLQYNKRDLADATPVGVMNRRLNFRSVPYFESVASRGVGVLDTFLAITRDTVSTTFRKYHLDKKIKDFDEMLALIETNVRSSLRELPPQEEAAGEILLPESTVLRHSTVSVMDLEPGKTADAQELLEDALKSNMETARLYSELKQVKEALEKRNEELNLLYAQLERSNQDNLKTRRYLEGLIQSVGEAIISFSHDGRILTWNAAAERIFGYSRSEIVGRTMQQLTPVRLEPEHARILERVGQGQTVRDVDSIRLRKGSAEFPVRITYAPIRGGDDKVLAFSALIRDMGEQKELEELVQRAGAASPLAAVLPSLLNELTNRLATALLQREALVQGVQDPGQAERASRLLGTVESLDTFLRPLAILFAPVPPKRVAANLNQLIQDAVQRVDADVAGVGASLELALDPGVQDSALDVDMVRECFVGLIRNSLAAVTQSDAKRIRIRSRQSGEALQVVCQDAGPALMEGDLERVFDPAGLKDVADMGLCVAAAVVKAHGGRISARSQEGVGNAYLMEFPMMDVAPAPKSSVSLQGARVLVVDDEAFLLECLSDALETWGCEVTTCSLASLAIQKLQEAEFDLILSDIRMPGLSGIQLFHWIRENQVRMASKILFTTGDTFDPDTRSFLEDANLPHLGKPFDLKVMKAALEELLAESSVRG